LSVHFSRDDLENRVLEGDRRRATSDREGRRTRSERARRSTSLSFLLCAIQENPERERERKDR
jgi:hypothetical protein